MSVVNNNLLLTADAGVTGYVIDRSLRFRSSASAYLSRTFGTPTNALRFTWSGWVKRGSLGTDQYLLSGYSGNSDSQYGVLYFFGSSNVLRFTGFNTIWRSTTQVFRDPSAWYHIVLAVDTTQATAANRIRMYVNGVEITSFATNNNPTQNTTVGVNTAIAHAQGADLYGGPLGFVDGYMTEVNFIDGQALTPSSFGEFDAITGVWKPKRFAGTYGTNGFYLDFKDPTSTSTLTADKSGRGNNWTANNISLTSGSTYDSMIDTPTPVEDERGNFCVWNSAAQSTVYNGTVTISNGNLTTVDGGTTYGVHAVGTFPMTVGKWYWEITATSMGGSFGAVGVVSTNHPLGLNHVGHNYWNAAFKKSNEVDAFSGTGSTSYGASWTTGDVIGIALDMDAGTLTYFKNGVSQGVASTGITGSWVPAVGDGQNATTYLFNANFGQRPFAYTPPSGFKALHTGNLPEPAIVDGSQYFDVVTRSGNNSSFTVTGLGFTPDFFWTKCRNTALAHYLADSVRGNDNILFSNLTNAEFSEPAYITATSADGYTIGAGPNVGNYNGSGGTYVDWLWKANGAGVSNTAGSITSTVSANPTAGFSIVTYTGTGSNATVGHGLGAAPAMVIVKGRVAQSTTSHWAVYHQSLGNTSRVWLNLTNAAVASSTYWNNTTPTSSVFSLGSEGAANESTRTYVAYCFAEVPGYSRFGSYTGNGSADGPFVFCGFRPRWILRKCSSDSTNKNWLIFDTARDPHNVASNFLFADLSAAEASSFDLDITSNGFKIRNSDVNRNGNGQTYIFAAFAEHPFKYSLAR